MCVLAPCTFTKFYLTNQPALEEYFSRSLGISLLTLALLCVLLTGSFPLTTSSSDRTFYSLEHLFPRPLRLTEISSFSSTDEHLSFRPIRHPNPDHYCPISLSHRFLLLRTVQSYAPIWLHIGSCGIWSSGGHRTVVYTIWWQFTHQ
jgi:hypothetical protein